MDKAGKDGDNSGAYGADCDLDKRRTDAETAAPGAQASQYLTAERTAPGAANRGRR